MSAIEAPSLWPTSSGSGASSWASSAGSTSSASSWKNAGVRGRRGGSERPWPKREKASTRRPVAACRACGKSRHSPTEPSPSCRSTSARRPRSPGEVGDLDVSPSTVAMAQPSRVAVRSATRCATCEHGARDRRRALEPARGRARDDRDRALPELAARRARTRPRGLRRAVALVGRRPRGLLGLGLGLLRRARAHALRARAGQARDARRRVVPRRAAELRRARAGDRRGHRPRGGRRALADARADRADLRRAARAGRARARGPAAPGRRPGRPRRRLPAQHPRDARRLHRDHQPRRDLGGCAPEFGARSVLARFGQIEPKVLLAVAGYTYRDRPIDRREQVAEIRAGCPPSSTSCTSPTARTSSRTPSGWDDAAAGPARSSSSRSRSTTRSTCSSRPAPPGCRRRSSTATAACSSSTSRRRPGLGPQARRAAAAVLDDRVDDVERARVRTARARLDRDDRRRPGVAGPSSQWRLAAETRPTHIGVRPTFLMRCRKAGVELGRDST